ncbi:hypothetical protein HMPREF7215_2112 [Pyramidobacter piscolens W5455]|uniref:Uncharacterized protein n=1 Tax=Pyramidobacter piscolens W5455 TaxID=352165 RepID=A0ABP2HTY4_9BACT|nr:hypothetical protein HMPREF7215_2112 [Pyramidobacter piscolens W5455]
MPWLDPSNNVIITPRTAACQWSAAGKTRRDRRAAKAIDGIISVRKIFCAGTTRREREHDLRTSA